MRKLKQNNLTSWRCGFYPRYKHLAPVLLPVELLDFYFEQAYSLQQVLLIANYNNDYETTSK